MDTYEWLRGVRAAPSDVLPFGTRGVLAILADGWMDRDGGSCFPSLSEIGKACNLTPRQVSRHLAPALDAGYLKRESGGLKGGKRSTRYDAALPACEPTRDTDVSGATWDTDVSGPADDRRPETPASPDLGHRRPTTNPLPTQGEPLNEGKSSGGGHAPKPSPAASAAPRPTPPVSAPLPVTEPDGWLKPTAMRCTTCRDMIGTERALGGATTCGPCSAHELRFDSAAPQPGDPWLRQGPAFGRVG